MIPFFEWERDVIEMLLSGNHPVLLALRRQKRGENLLSLHLVGTCCR